MTVFCTVNATTHILSPGRIPLAQCDLDGDYSSLNRFVVSVNYIH